MLSIRNRPPRWCHTFSESMVLLRCKNFLSADERGFRGFFYQITTAALESLLTVEYVFAGAGTFDDEPKRGTGTSRAPFDLR
jgi:hypothetical protein